MWHSEGYISKGTLSGAVCPSSSHSGDPGHSPTSTPGLCTGLVTSLGGHSIWLPLVLGHVGVHKLDNVLTDRGLEDRRHGDLGSHLALLVEYSYQRSCRLNEKAENPTVISCSTSLLVTSQLSMSVSRKQTMALPWPRLPSLLVYCELSSPMEVDSPPIRTRSTSSLNHEVNQARATNLRMRSAAKLI